MTNVNEKMDYLISHARADVNLTAMCFQLIKSAPTTEKPKLLESFLIGYKSTPTKGDVNLPQVISDDEERKLMHRYGKIVDAFMEDLQEQGLAELEFYTQLWEYIENSPVLPNDKARVIALFDCAIDKRLPYYQVDRSKMLSMENGEYQAIAERIGERNFAKMEYILCASFEQKTERSSLIVQMLDEIKDYEAKCVFMARIMSHYDNEIMKMRLKELLSED